MQEGNLTCLSNHDRIRPEALSLKTTSDSKKGRSAVKTISALFCLLMLVAGAAGQEVRPITSIECGPACQAEKAQKRKQTRRTPRPAATPTPTPVPDTEPEPELACCEELVTEVKSTHETTKKGFAKLDALLTQTNKKLDDTNKKLDEIDSGMDKLAEAMALLLGMQKEQLELARDNKEIQLAILGKLTEIEKNQPGKLERILAAADNGMGIADKFMSWLGIGHNKSNNTYYAVNNRGGGGGRRYDDGNDDCARGTCNHREHQNRRRDRDDRDRNPPDCGPTRVRNGAPLGGIDPRCRDTRNRRGVIRLPDERANRQDPIPRHRDWDDANPLVNTRNTRSGFRSSSFSSSGTQDRVSRRDEQRRSTRDFSSSSARSSRSFTSRNRGPSRVW